MMMGGYCIFNQVAIVDLDCEMEQSIMNMKAIIAVLVT
jgi:hypothetical protein